MQPSPRAETVRPERPRERVFMNELRAGNGANLSDCSIDARFSLQGSVGRKRRPGPVNLGLLTFVLFRPCPVGTSCHCPDSHTLVDGERMTVDEELTLLETQLR